MREASATIERFREALLRARREELERHERDLARLDRAIAALDLAGMLKKEPRPRKRPHWSAKARSDASERMKAWHAARKRGARDARR